ncbi:hypothetical protein CTEN210_06377 [Chaetoceros tenuissimus]|uniref:Uncharacterized protein n=1 Tax=Chaetoceros tenuissimus TaxID=426638 RepID=A0AAD3CPQ4_9STRA|nr:hypothetical protein CTEN210_06377 [Chaetoceros tenuissimus]
MDISTLQSNIDFIKSLYSNKEWKDEECRDDILEAIEECNQKIEKTFGWSMHKLHLHKPSIEAVEKVAMKFPSTLSYVDVVDGQIPIQSAATRDGYEYVPVLAKEGIKRKIGGKDARGGLLLTDPSHDYGWNTLQCFINVGDDADEDAERVNVMKELRRSALILKKDIQEYNLLHVSCYEFTKERCEYLVSWDPDALVETRFRNKPLIHYFVDEKESLQLLLKIGFKYHANIGGILFVKDDEGTTGLNCMCDEIGVDEVLTMLHYPILHHVFVMAPHQKDSFMKQFPWAYHLRDHNDRTLHQAVLAAGPDAVNNNNVILASLTDGQIRTKDPLTTLYPFAAMAVGEHADLESTFYLLRRQPSVMDRHSRSESDSSSNRRRKKRKVEK